MKAIGLDQPWASFLAIGLKKIETRSRPIHYRGPLAIHANKAWGPKHRHAWDELCLGWGEVWTRLREVAAVPGGIPLGAIVATVEVVGCDLMTPELIAAQTPLERALGDWRPGRYAWRLANVRRLATPVPARGKQGFFEVDLEPKAGP